MRTIPIIAGKGIKKGRKIFKNLKIYKNFIKLLQNIFFKAIIYLNFTYIIVVL